MIRNAQKRERFIRCSRRNAETVEQEARAARTRALERRQGTRVKRTVRVSQRHVFNSLSVREKDISTGDYFRFLNAE
jgi:hypothetical protein